MVVAQWKVENREGKGGERGKGGDSEWVLFPSMFLSQLCNEGKMQGGRADQGVCSS